MIPVLKAVALGLIGLSGSGCLIGFDAGGLSGGRADSGMPAGSPGSGDTSNDLGISAACDNFATYASGMPLPNWVDGRGTWRVMDTASGKMLMQTVDGTSRSDRFVAWQGGKDYTDASISASVTLDAQTDMNCVLLRVQDALNYYGLCVSDVSGRNHSPAYEWRLNLVSAGIETRLASGSLASAGSHTLALRAQGSTLSAVVDAQAKPAITDETLNHGSLGVSTDDHGGFTTLCTVPQ